jgi:hypothetical protein
MGKNSNTFKSKSIKSKSINSKSINSKSIKSKSIKSKSVKKRDKNENENENENENKNKNKNKKLLKKMMNNNSKLNNTNQILDNSDFILNETDSLLEENIQILIGGGKSSDFVEPSEFDKLLGYEGPVDTSGPLDKLSDNIEITMDYMSNSFGSVANVTKGLIAHKVSDVIGMEGKTPEEVAQILKNDTQKLEQVNDYLQTNDGKKMLNEVQELTNTATGVIGESIKQIPDKVDESMDKLAKNAVDAGVGALTDIPGVNVVVGTSKIISGVQGATSDIAEATGQVASLVGDTAEKIKKPIDDIEKKMDEISDKIEEVPELPEIDESLINESSIDESSIDESSTDEKNIQLGGSNINKFLFYGGKKIRKRVNNTRHAFKNISKNITKKNK